MEHWWGQRGAHQYTLSAYYVSYTVLVLIYLCNFHNNPWLWVLLLWFTMRRLRLRGLKSTRWPKRHRWDLNPVFAVSGYIIKLKNDKNMYKILQFIWVWVQLKWMKHYLSIYRVISMQQKEHKIFQWLLRAKRKELRRQGLFKNTSCFIKPSLKIQGKNQAKKFKCVISCWYNHR